MSHILPEAVGNSPAEPEHWVDRHGDGLYSFALMKVGDSAVAEDLVQETFLAALKSCDSFQGNSSERTWLVGILKHKIVDHYRKTGRDRTSEHTDLLANESDPFLENGEWAGHWKPGRQPQSWDFVPDIVFENAEFWNVLQDCLKELPPRTARAFWMREVEELSSEEICKVLSITATNLWVILHRARMQLRQSLQVKWFDQQAKANKSHAISTST